MEAAAVSRPGDDIQHLNIPFQEISSVELDRSAERALAEGSLTRSVTQTTAEMTICGPCPRCGGQFSQSQPLLIWVSTLRRPGAPGELPEVADFECDCAMAHPDTPPGRSGCGAVFSVPVSREPKTDREAVPT